MEWGGAGSRCGVPKMETKVCGGAGYPVVEELGSWGRVDQSSSMVLHGV